MSNTPANTKPSENLNIVIVGHVDHGKSTLLGRLYADTGSLPDGKLEKVQAICRQQGKEFEYAFLFDAFLEEQEQGITIDTARTFFIWKGRQYIIIDAPGHKEFLKNMISGAARAEAALVGVPPPAAAAAYVEDHRLGGLLRPVAADDADFLGAPFGFVLDHPEFCLGLGQQRDESVENLTHRLLSGHGRPSRTTA